MRGRRLALALVGCLVMAKPGHAQTPSLDAPSLDAPTLQAGGLQAPHVQRAAARFGLPAELIAEVIRVESRGRPDVVSRAGAMGLMQLMPGTWAELRGRLGLGADPFDPADNVMAGAAYLRMLLDRYGAPGFLAAYNAGPGRYEESLAGRPLPLETRQYVERLSGVATPRARALEWREAGLFAAPWSIELGASQAASDTANAPSGDLFASRRSPWP